MTVRRLLVAASGLFLACASRSDESPTPQPAPTTARCQAINDSLAALTSLAALPEGAFRDGGVYRSPALPGGTPKGAQVLVRYVARPDGTAEPSVLEIEGTDDAAFRERAIARIRRVRLLPATIEGCRVRSRIDVYVTKL